MSYNRLLIFEYNDKPLLYKVLRFNPVQIGEWLDELFAENMLRKDTAVVTLADRLEISRGRVIQFLNLMRIPVDLRRRLSGMPDLTEARLRGIVQMDGTAMRMAVGRLLGMGVVAKAG